MLNILIKYNNIIYNIIKMDLFALPLSIDSDIDLLLKATYYQDESIEDVKKFTISQDLLNIYNIEVEYNYYVFNLYESYSCLYMFSESVKKNNTDLLLTNDILKQQLSEYEKQIFTSSRNKAKAQFTVLNICEENITFLK
jgi:hypothetical protein